jgi:hypothetical protein
MKINLIVIVLVLVINSCKPVDSGILCSELSENYGFRVFSHKTNNTIIHCCDDADKYNSYLSYLTNEKGDTIRKDQTIGRDGSMWVDIGAEDKKIGQNVVDRYFLYLEAFKDKLPLDVDTIDIKYSLFSKDGSRCFAKIENFEVYYNNVKQNVNRFDVPNKLYKD